jgi:hypothetical protein
LYRLSLTLDAFLKFGTLAERTDKQPGVPGTQPENAEYFRVAAKNSDFDRWGIKT